MGINEIDLTIYPYTVGRQDCKVLPRSFKTQAEAEAYLANQDAREQGEFYLDGPEQDDTASSSCSIRTPDPKVIVTSPPAAERGAADSDCTPMEIKPQMKGGVWKREIEELCRALEAES